MSQLLISFACTFPPLSLSRARMEFFSSTEMTLQKLVLRLFFGGLHLTAFFANSVYNALTYRKAFSPMSVISFIWLLAKGSLAIVWTGFKSLV